MRSYQGLRRRPGAGERWQPRRQRPTATGTVPAQLSMVLTTADETQAVVLALQR